MQLYFWITISAVGFITARLMFGPFYLAGLYNVISPPGVKEYRDISFSTQHKRLKLDIYCPTTSKKNYPVIVFFHGGGWNSNNKDIFKFIGRSLARQGLLVAVPNYRLAPEYKFPVQINDAAQAVRWVEKNIGQYGGDNEKITLSGHSAGGHLAALLGYADKWQQKYDITPNNIERLILLAGVYKFSPSYKEGHELIKNFVPEEYWEEAQPVNHINKNVPYTLLLHGERDKTVQARQTKYLAKILKVKNIKHDLTIYSAHNHFSLLLSLVRTDMGLLFKPAEKERLKRG